MPLSQNKRVLITGIKGFTGKYLAAELSAAGYDVYGIGCQPVQAEDKNYFCADLTDESSIRKVIREVRPNFVAHLAAIAFVAHQDIAAFYQVNILGTLNLLHALSVENLDLESILLASSANVYGNGYHGALTETTPVNPINDYAVSKLSMEYMARLWFDKLPIFIVRPFNYTGVGQSTHFLIPKIIEHFQQKKTEIELGNLDVWRDFSDVRTLVSVYRQLLEQKPVAKVINVASGELYSLKEIVCLCEELSGHTINIKINPAFVRENEVKELCGDITLLRSLINDYKPILIRKTLTWMLFTYVKDHLRC